MIGGSHGNGSRIERRDVGHEPYRATGAFGDEHGRQARRVEEMMRIKLKAAARAGRGLDYSGPLPPVPCAALDTPGIAAPIDLHIGVAPSRERLRAETVAVEALGFPRGDARAKQIGKRLFGRQ